MEAGRILFEPPAEALVSDVDQRNQTAHGGTLCNLGPLQRG